MEQNNQQNKEKRLDELYNRIAQNIVKVLKTFVMYPIILLLLNWAIIVPCGGNTITYVESSVYIVVLTLLYRMRNDGNR